MIDFIERYSGAFLLLFVAILMAAGNLLEESRDRSPLTRECLMSLPVGAEVESLETRLTEEGAEVIIRYAKEGRHREVWCYSHE